MKRGLGSFGGGRVTPFFFFFFCIELLRWCDCGGRGKVDCTHTGNVLSFRPSVCCSQFPPTEVDFIGGNALLKV